MSRGGAGAVRTDWIVFLTEVNITSSFFTVLFCLLWNGTVGLHTKARKSHLSCSEPLFQSRPVSFFLLFTLFPASLLTKKGKQSDRTHVCGNFHDYACKNVPLWLDFKQMQRAKSGLVYQWSCQKGFCGRLWDKNLTWEHLKKLLPLCLWHRNNPHTGPNLPWCHSPCF